MRVLRLGYTAVEDAVSRAIVVVGLHVTNFDKDILDVLVGAHIGEIGQRPTIRILQPEVGLPVSAPQVFNSQLSRRPSPSVSWTSVLNTIAPHDRQSKVLKPT